MSSFQLAHSIFNKTEIILQFLHTRHFCQTIYMLFLIAVTLSESNSNQSNSYQSNFCASALSFPLKLSLILFQITGSKTITEMYTQYLELICPSLYIVVDLIWKIHIVISKTQTLPSLDRHQLPSFCPFWTLPLLPVSAALEVLPSLAFSSLLHSFPCP